MSPSGGEAGRGAPLSGTSFCVGDVLAGGALPAPSVTECMPPREPALALPAAVAPPQPLPSSVVVPPPARTGLVVLALAAFALVVVLGWALSRRPASTRAAAADAGASRR